VGWIEQSEGLWVKWINRGASFGLMRGPNRLHPKIWEGRLSPVSFRKYKPDDLPQCLEIYSLNEPGRFPELDPSPCNHTWTKLSPVDIPADKERVASLSDSV